MDETVMHDWIDCILEPYVKEEPTGIVPVLFLDSYRCHMMTAVVSRIQDLGVEVFHIPGGCTGLCQPVDVGFNKPFKTRIRSQWEDWMVAAWDGIPTKVTPKPSREIVSDWLCRAFDDFPGHLIRNAWTKTGYAWFDKTPEDNIEMMEEEMDIIDNEDDDDNMVLRMVWNDPKSVGVV